MKKENNSAENEDERASQEHDDRTREEDAKPQEESFASASCKPKQVMMTDEDLRVLQKELLEYKDKYLRLLADSENARKRLQKEKQELTRYAIEGIVTDFLRPLDNLENALRFAQQMSDEVKNWAIGFQMIATQFKDILSNHGVNSFDSMGEPFNPHEHEAVEMIETDDFKEGIIIEECIRGYKMGEKTIRAARVKVAKGPAKLKPSENLK